MAWTSGTADNYLHLLEILRNYLAANGYTILHSSTTQFYCKGPGLEGLDEIYWGIDTLENSGAGYWNWRLAGSWGYKEGRQTINQIGSSNIVGYGAVYLWNQAIPYWFAVNGRRCFMLAKVGTVYQAMYMGLGIGMGTPQQYPYPLIIGGCGSSTTSTYNSTGGGNALFFGHNAGDHGFAGGPGRLIDPGGDWSAMSTPSSLQRGQIPGGGYYTTRNFISNLMFALDGTYLLEPIYFGQLVGNVGPAAPWQVPIVSLDGVFKISGYNNSAENIVSVDGASYLVFPDTYRSTRADYFAVKME